MLKIMVIRISNALVCNIPVGHCGRWFGLVVSLSLLGGTLAADQKPAADKATDGKPVDPDHAEKMARGLDLFRKQVRKVLVQNCLECHGGETVESEFSLVD